MQKLFIFDQPFLVTSHKIFPKLFIKLQDNLKSNIKKIIGSSQHLKAFLRFLNVYLESVIEIVCFTYMS